MTAALAVSETTRDLRAEVSALQAADRRLTQAEICRQSGINTARFSQWLAGKYTGDNEGVETEVARWIDAYARRKAEERALPVAPAWVSTPTGERVLSVLTYAQVLQDIVLVYGASGVSKTQAARQHQRTNPNVWIVTMTPSTAGGVPALEEIAIALGCELGGGAAALKRRIYRRVTNTQGLLVIDEAQHLTTQSLDEIRQIHDATGVGIALIGNETVYANMTGGGARAAHLDRLFGRVGKRVRLTRATQEDVDALLAAWGLGTEFRQIARQIAAKPGALRVVTKVIKNAILTARGAGRDMVPSDLQSAWRDLGGE